MAEQQQIAGRHGITVYGTQSISVGGDLPQEDPSKWAPKLLDAKAVCKRYDWTIDDLNAAPGRFGFPKHVKATEVAGTMFRMGYTKYWWKEEAIVAWEGGIRTLAAKLK